MLFFLKYFMFLALLRSFAYVRASPARGPAPAAPPPCCFSKQEGGEARRAQGGAGRAARGLR